MVERQMMRGAIPVLLLAFGAIAGCTCNGNVSPLTDGGNVVADAGTDSGPPPVNDCAYYYCPPISSDGGLVVITFGNPDGGIIELARYISVIPIDGLGNPNHSTSAQVYNPSRTAIDINSDFWVANF